MFVVKELAKTSISSFESLQEATENIFSHALYLKDFKQVLSKKQYKELVAKQGWDGEDKKYLKIATAFSNFSAEDLAAVEPDTLFLLAKHQKKYQRVIDKMMDSVQINQALVRSLMEEERKRQRLERLPKSQKPSIWRRTPDAGRYCQIPPIHEVDDQTGMIIQKAMDEEGLLPQQIIREAVALWQASKQANLSEAPEATPSLEVSEEIEDLDTAIDEQSSNANESLEEEPVEAKQVIQTAVALQQATTWEEVMKITAICDDKLKSAAWKRLNTEQKRHIHQLKKQYLHGIEDTSSWAGGLSGKNKS